MGKVGIWNTKTNEWVFTCECIYDVETYSPEQVYYKPEDVVYEDDGNYVYGLRRVEFDNIEDAKFWLAYDNCEFEEVRDI